jgi:hypothetical protein
MPSLLMFNRVYRLEILSASEEPVCIYLFEQNPVFTLLESGPRRGEGLRQINTCRKVPLQVNFFR